LKNTKTNAMRMLENEKIDYSIITYNADDGKIDGISVAEKIARDTKEVYKTLITQGSSKQYFVFVIPVAEELDLKKAARAVGDKKIEMIPVKDIMKVSGYIRGGCSPIGMKKSFPTFIDSSAKSLEKIIVSGGKIGIQIELTVANLLNMVHGTFGDVLK